ncbi:hypothetical protein H6P81_011368 [Aristolochia fimbriata]|uniref:Uncharacterized protein n=1 Tax=Aristolochia fimbriata TaxID=158543 RepID=A0AAV7ERB5_ARIFI|nr:hypothetical protein H6P81_011368 [Aristolochia fimbriata]
MRSLCILLFLLFLLSCFVSETQTVLGVSLPVADKARPSGAVSSSKDFPLYGRKFKVLDGPHDKMDKERKGSLAVEEEEQQQKYDEELIYNVDYHGVSTHPSPSPKHPRPKH